MPFVLFVAIALFIAIPIVSLVGALLFVAVERKVGEMYFEHKYRGYREYTDQYYRDYMKYKW